MMNRPPPPRVCAQAGCRYLSRGRFCPLHERVALPQPTTPSGTALVRESP